MWPGCSRSKTPFVKTTVLPFARTAATNARASSRVTIAARCRAPSALRLEDDAVGERPRMPRPVDADVVDAGLDAEGIEQAMVVVRDAVALVHGDVDLVGAFDQIEAVDGEGRFGVAGEAHRRHLLEIGVRAVAADALGVEQADAEDEVVGRLRGADPDAN